MTNRTRFSLLVAYGVANFLAFPHPVGERVVDLGLLCGWLSPALLILGLYGQSPRAAAKAAFVAGTLAQSAILHWIYIVSVEYGHAAPPMGVIGIFGIGADSRRLDWKSVREILTAWVTTLPLAAVLAASALWALR